MKSPEISSSVIPSESNTSLSRAAASFNAARLSQCVYAEPGYSSQQYRHAGSRLRASRIQAGSWQVFLGILEYQLWPVPCSFYFMYLCVHNSYNTRYSSLMLKFRLRGKKKRARRCKLLNLRQKRFAWNVGAQTKVAKGIHEGEPQNFSASNLQFTNGPGRVKTRRGLSSG